jgi:hypothetical protein
VVELIVKNLLQNYEKKRGAQKSFFTINALNCPILLKKHRYDSKIEGICRIKGFWRV